MSTETSLVLIKPDAVNRNLVGPVLTKLNETKLTLAGGKMMKVPLELAKKHYAEHEGKPFYPQLLDYITGKLHQGPNNWVMALVFKGENAIKTIRALAGNTNPEKADKDTIRGMFGRITTEGVFENVVHASASPEEGVNEAKLWFTDKELIG